MRALAVVLVLAACGGPAAPGPSIVPAAAATPLPALEYRLMTGESWASRQSAGRVLVLDVWATYCKPCRKAFPRLNRLAATYPDIVVIGVSVDEEDAAVRAFLAEVPAAFPIARDPARSVQSGPLAIRSLPTLLVVDRHGRTRFRAEETVEADYDAVAGLVAALRAE